MISMNRMYVHEIMLWRDALGVWEEPHTWPWHHSASFCELPELSGVGAQDVRLKSTQIIEAGTPTQGAMDEPGAVAEGWGAWLGIVMGT